jgi:beta-1,4-mannooligosaccharide/beta-1,4-mannosyl-N-acetylglucosamine phosphorylase
MPDKIFSRSTLNPLLHGKNVPFKADLVFNPGVAFFNGSYVMIFRFEHGPFNGKILAHTGLAFAWSEDGITWEAKAIQPFNLDEMEVNRVYDPRLTVLESQLYLTFAADTPYGIRGGLAVAGNNESFTVLDLTLPDNRNQVLFPEKINGYFWRLERPFSVYGKQGTEQFDMWISKSPDLIHWGNSRLVLSAGAVPWANSKIGPGTPPLKTSRGWLIFFHGVDNDNRRGKNGWEEQWNKRYRAGAALLDLNEPWKIVAISPEPVLSPEAPYETENGFRNNVVFPGGAVIESDKSVKLYYGAADTCICLAVCSLDSLMDSLISYPKQHSLR